MVGDCMSDGMKLGMSENDRSSGMLNSCGHPADCAAGDGSLATLDLPPMLPMYSSFEIKTKCSFLALLGDIGYVHADELLTFLERQLEEFEIVFYVLGNHEPYQLVGSQIDFPRQRAVRIIEAFETRIGAMGKDVVAAPLGRFAC